MDIKDAITAIKGLVTMIEEKSNHADKCSQDYLLAVSDLNHLATQLADITARVNSGTFKKVKPHG